MREIAEIKFQNQPLISDALKDTQGSAIEKSLILKKNQPLTVEVSFQVKGSYVKDLLVRVKSIRPPGTLASIFGALPKIAAAATVLTILISVVIIVSYNSQNNELFRLNQNLQKDKSDLQLAINNAKGELDVFQDSVELIAGRVERLTHVRELMDCVEIYREAAQYHTLGLSNKVLFFKNKRYLKRARELYISASACGIDTEHEVSEVDKII